MRPLRISALRILLVLTASVVTGEVAQAGLTVAIVHADTAGSSASLQAKLVGTGLFSQVDLIDAGDVNGTPTLAQLLGYDAVLSYTNFAPDDATALGNVLGHYVDAGRGVVLATYGLGNVSVVGGTAFSGKIAAPGYSPLVISGSLGNLDGGISAIVPGDPIFAGVNLGVQNFYYHDAFFAHPGLDAGATLLATDTSGVNLIARSANGHVLAMNLFPGSATTENSDEFTTLLANALLDTADRNAQAVPEPATLALAAPVGLFAVLMTRRSRKGRRR